MRLHALIAALGLVGCGGAAPRRAPIASRGPSFPELRARMQAARTPGERIVASAALGEALWRASCPSASAIDLCIEQRRPTVGAGTTCAPAEVEILRTERGPDADEAVEHLRDVEQMWARLDAEARDATTAGAEATAALLLADGATERFLGSTPPGNLDFTRDRDGSMQRYQGWMRDALTAMQEANERYMHVLDDQRLTSLDPAAAVAAVAGIGRLTGRMADVLREMPVPGDVASMGPDAVGAFCGAMSDQADALEEKAVDALRSCVDKAAELGVTGSVPDGCRDAYHARRPNEPL